MLETIFKILRYPRRYLLKVEFFKAVKLNEKFSIIYKNNYWDNKESISGPGSTIKNTRNLRYVLKKIIKKYKVRTIFDAPCGDCNWIKFIFKKDQPKYIGADIVKDCVSKNKNKFKRKNLSFKQLDITKDKLPNTDLFICRDFMFHLSFKDNYKFLKNLRKINTKYILISSHTKNLKSSIINRDIKSGDFRKINLFRSPFNFKTNYELVVKDYCDGVEKYLLLFKKKEFRKFSDYMKI
tara:strand:+ start:26 stop:739 length:714 start_codon:yes stop_codon:yes gene_type:complete